MIHTVVYRSALRFALESAEGAGLLPLVLFTSTCGNCSVRMLSSIRQNELVPNRIPAPFEPRPRRVEIVHPRISHCIEPPSET